MLPRAKNNQLMVEPMMVLDPGDDGVVVAFLVVATLRAKFWPFIKTVVDSQLISDCLTVTQVLFGLLACSGTKPLRFFCQQNCGTDLQSVGFQVC